VLADRFDQEVVAVFWAVSVHASLAAHLVRGSAQRLDDRRREGQRDVADAQPDDRRVGVRGAEFANPARNFGEQVASPEFAVVLVDPRHRGST